MTEDDRAQEIVDLLTEMACALNSLASNFATVTEALLEDRGKADELL